MPTLASDHDCLLAAVLANPADDAPRLAYADWLDEDGQDRMAKAVRWGVAHPENSQVCLCHWPLGKMPELCAICLGRSDLGGIPRREPGGDTPYVIHRGLVSELRLPTEAFVAVAADLFRRHPVTKVVLTGAEPFEGRKLWSWYDVKYQDNYHPQSDVPSEIFALLTGHQDYVHEGKWYQSEEAARADLSAACVRFGRRAAGL